MLALVFSINIIGVIWHSCLRVMCSFNDLCLTQLFVGGPTKRKRSMDLVDGEEISQHHSVILWNHVVLYRTAVICFLPEDILCSFSLQYSLDEANIKR